MFISPTEHISLMQFAASHIQLPAGPQYWPRMHEYGQQEAISPPMHIQQPEHMPQGFAPYAGVPITWPPQTLGLGETSVASDTISVDTDTISVDSDTISVGSDTISVAESHEGVVGSELSDLSDTCSENEV